MNKLMMVLACSMCVLPVWAASAFQAQALQEIPDPPTRPIASPAPAAFPATVFSNQGTSNVRGWAVDKRRKADPLAQAIELLKNAENGDSEEEAKDAIREELENQYDEFLVANEQQIEDLQTRLDDLRDQLDRRRRAKKKMVELEMERVVNESEGLIWPANKRATNGPFGVIYNRDGRTNWRPAEVRGRSTQSRSATEVRRTRRSDDPFATSGRDSASGK